MRPPTTCARSSRGFLALGRMTNDPKATALINSLQLSGTGKTVKLSFSVPSEVLDMIPTKKVASVGQPHLLPQELHAAVSGFRLTQKAGPIGSAFSGTAVGGRHRGSGSVSERLAACPLPILPSVLRFPSCGELVFFYGTLMAGFDRRRRAGIDDKLTYIGRGSIQGALFDLGLYPAAVPAPDGHVWGEVYEMAEPATVLAALDEIEGYRHDDPDRSLYLPPAGRSALAGRQPARRRGSISTTRRSGARRASRQATISNTRECDENGS